MIDSVQKANTEVLDSDFDIVAEQEALSRICRDETVQVAELMGDVAMVASRQGIVNMVPARQLVQLPDGAEAVGQYIVYIWHGRIWNTKFGRHGSPHSFGPYLIKFYNRDRVAEILAKYKESLK